MNQPLYKLAVLRKLPKHQFMDLDTLDWISKNIPKDIKDIECFSIKKNYTRDIFNIANFIPRGDWYANKQIADGIHGKLHAFRVAVYVVILNELLRLGLSKKILMLAGLFHDIQRVDDRDDVKHSQRSSYWIKKNKKVVEDFFNFRISYEELEFVIQAVFYHDVDYKFSEKAGLTKKQKEYLDVLRASDALDRFRLPQIKWWIKDSFLKIPPPFDVKRFAFDLIINTERANLEDNPLQESLQCFLQI